MDRLRDKAPGAVIALGADLDGAAVVIAATGPKLRGDKRFHAGQLVKAITLKLDGRGGGRPDFAQGGGKDVSKLADALADVPQLLGG